MAVPLRHFLTQEQYLALERVSEVRHEYFAGQIFAMAGGTAELSQLAGNLIRELGNGFKGRPGRAYGSDMRVKIPATGLYTYPDVSSLCGEPRFEDERRETLLNPSVIFEVLSESSEAYDRDRKFAQYQTIESLREYVLIAQDRVRVERYVRQEDGREWLPAVFEDLGQSLTLTSVECEIRLAEIYDKVDFPALPGA